MTYEVEMKFRLCEPDSKNGEPAIVALLDELRATRGEPIDQCDLYFAHPQRDFAVTDEALRIRRVGDRNQMTYKGPKIDALTKTRKEIEIALADGAATAEQLAQVLEILGFKPIRRVEKRRLPFHLNWEDREVELALDSLAGLGTFLEIETLADDADRDAARDSVLRLAARLGLADSERRSYLGLLLEQETQQSTEPFSADE